MQGWVSLHRRINNSETFEKLNILQKLIAIYIILNASHTDRVWYDKYKDIEVNLKRGELITSRNTIKKDWFHGDKEVTDAKIRTTFKKLERFGFLTIETTNNYTKLKVCNYNLYQGEERRSNQVNNQEGTKTKPRENQGKTTINKVKNVKNDKSSDIYSIYEYWNEKKITVHRELNQTRKSKINPRLANYSVDEIKKAIDNYSYILNNEEYYYTHKFKLERFMDTGILDNFLDENNPFENYKKNDKLSKSQSNKDNIEQIRKELGHSEQRRSVKDVTADTKRLL